MEWISIEERKPDENQVVFVVTVSNFMMIMVYMYIYDAEESGWVWANVYDSPTYSSKANEWEADGEWEDDYEVTHWMPLPESPNKTIEP
nr:DUF551 domain-containing protein [uncultured Allomuricauda sp.]